MARKTIKVTTIVESMVFYYFERDLFKRRANAYLSDEYIDSETGTFSEYSIERRKANNRMSEYYDDRYRAIRSLLSDIVEYSKYDDFIDDCDNAMDKGVAVGDREIALNAFMEVWEKYA